MNTKNDVKPLAFDEDTFDLAAHKKAANELTKGKSQVKRIRRQVVIGKVLLAIAAIIIFFLIYRMVASTNFLMDIF